MEGGRLTPGVVRIGDTVRRPSSPFTGVLLARLAGFDGCPRFLGRDDLGRDVLSYIPGEVPAKWRAFSDDQVAAAGALLRRFHDATRPDVVCHHDSGPNNTVFRDGLPVAFIDFDFAAPGDPLSDVAYMAWSWCISSKPSRGDAPSQARQVRVLADAYGLTAAQRAALPDAVDERFARNERFWGERTEVIAGPPPAEVLTWTRTERTFATRHRPVFEAALV